MEVIYVDGYDGTVKEVFGPVTFDLSGIKVLDYLATIKDNKVGEQGED